MKDGAQEALGKASPSEGAGWRSGDQGEGKEGELFNRGRSCPQGTTGMGGGQGNQGQGRASGRAPGSGQMGAVLTQGCPGPVGSVQSGQQGSRPSCSVHMAWELDPEQLMMEQGPQGGGQEGETTGRQTPKLSTKNGRFEPCECCPWGSNRGQMGKASGAT